ncbi:uncharacterized protein EURHEDRAFT_173821 [Aspergillus ruber CBS 135680]|uniref:Uncharacterized protein n=1 Tax=Aspergillus ruber (strain CBS 135680) TaxID=1388766 RepID=A0A017S7J4_ASPRC|nr:uncharacterized protein EURHEDRAFT_173821 [Aspergillus ruber CBS 135680]EYE93008.1 hypothetical protein EURHEDRAFT_173821 [Aspergillus ruber CBS 135680]
MNSALSMFPVSCEPPRSCLPLQIPHLASEGTGLFPDRVSVVRLDGWSMLSLDARGPLFTIVSFLVLVLVHYHIILLICLVSLLTGGS